MYLQNFSCCGSQGGQRIQPLLVAWCALQQIAFTLHFLLLLASAKPEQWRLYNLGASKPYAANSGTDLRPQSGPIFETTSRKP